MFRMSFDPWWAENVEELILSTFMCTHASCIRVWLGCMC